MKKFFFLAAVLSGVLFTACSDEKENEPRPGTIVFEVSAVNKISDGLDTRNIYSQTPVQTVSTVKVYAFKYDGEDFKYFHTFDVTGWPAGGTNYHYEVPTDEIFTDGGVFKFVAVGQNSGDTSYTVGGASGPTISTTYDSFVATGLPIIQYDIFAGGTDAITIAEGGTARVAITMTRKVAGVMGYFSNVPTAVNGTPVTALVVIVQETGNSAVNLVTGVGGTPSILSGFNVVGRINFASPGTPADGFYPSNNVVAAQLDNTQLDGLFVMPMASATLKVRLYGAGSGDGQLLKEWTVKNTAGDTSFPLLANHLYSLGTKPTTNSTTGDNPINLSKDEVITITLSPAWDTIHGLDVQ